MTDKSIPQLLKELRNSAKKTQADAAKECCIDVRSWERYESGEKNPSDTLIKLFCVLNGFDSEKTLKDIETIRMKTMKTADIYLQQMSEIGAEQKLSRPLDELINILIKKNDALSLGMLVAAAADRILEKNGNRPDHRRVYEFCLIFQAMVEKVYDGKLQKVRDDRSILIAAYQALVAKQQ